MNYLCLFKICISFLFKTYTLSLLKTLVSANNFEIAILICAADDMVMGLGMVLCIIINCFVFTETLLM